jgi:hypothetical protein
MAFQGSLAELHLPDIVQLMSVSGKTGVFHLTDGPLKGEIYLRDGQIVHAQLEDLQGEDAVYALAIWNKGDFRFDAGTATELRTVTKSNTNLLMEAARRLDEWRVLAKKIPSIEMVPEFVILEGREGQINLNTGEWLILSKIDGRRSLKQVALASKLTVFEAAKMLYGLIGGGLIRLKDPAAVSTGGTAKMPALPATAGAPAAAATTPAKPAAAAPKPGQTASRAVPAPAGGVPAVDLLARLNRVRDTSNNFLGTVGEATVAKHYQKARSDLEKGAGPEAIDDAIQHIAKATAILKGAPASEMLLLQLKALK